MNNQEHNYSDFLKNIDPKSVFLCIILLWVMSFGFAIYGTTKSDMNHFGLFGDFFGSVNALFSGLALAGVILSLLMQHDELKDTRDEIKGQKEAIEKQNFDKIFFSLFDSLNNIKNSLQYIDQNATPAIDYRGNTVFLVIVEDFIKTASINNYDSNYACRVLDNNLLQKLINKYPVEPYVRSLNTVIKFIDNYNDPKIDKKFYYELVRDSITVSECGIIYFLGTMKENTALKNFIEKYGIFHVLEKSDTVPFTKLPSRYVYSKQAFKDQKSPAA